LPTSTATAISTSSKTRCSTRSSRIQLDTSPGFEGSYLRVRVLDSQGLQTEHGAVIRLRPLNGAAGLVQTRTVGGGGSYLSKPEYTAHFGLGVPGQVVAVPDQPDYTKGSTVQLTAVPEAGYRFTGWTGDASGTQNPLTSRWTARGTSPRPSR
jgi:hypothetical protein